MDTVSTKSRNSRRDEEQLSAEMLDEDSLEISPLAWRVTSILVLAGAAFIRLYDLGLKPMHHDEGVNGFFLTNLYRTGVYHYDPNNYHGPTLYYFALAITKINGLLFGQQAGLSTIAVRLVPVIFGIGTVWLILCLRRYIGSVGALAAAAFVALSPGHVFISRYFIHESHFVFFTLGIVVAFLHYYEQKLPTILATSALALMLFVILVPSAHSSFLYLFPSINVAVLAVISVVWGGGLTLAAVYALYAKDEGRQIYLLLAFTSAALLFATKETAMISAGVLLLSLAVAWSYALLFPQETAVNWEKKAVSKRKAKRQGIRREGPLDRFGGLLNIAFWTSIALVLFFLINILFYSSFFTYWQGVSGALESIQVWAKTGAKEHAHPFLTYLIWLWQEESPLLILGTIGGLLALGLRRNRFAVFIGAWAFGLLLAYSLITYKTPWLMINFTVPMAIAGGYAINEIYVYGKRLGLYFAALVLVVAALTILSIQTVSLNFYHYDDDSYPYVYAHTQREFLTMVEEIENLSKRAGTDKQTRITITSKDYWPLPWYLRNYEHAGFFGQMTTSEDPLILGSIDQVPELDAMLGDRYQKVNTYALRPGVTLVLYAKKELVEPEKQ